MLRVQLFVNYSSANFIEDFRAAPIASLAFPPVFMRVFSGFVANLKTRRCSGRRTISKASEVWQALFDKRLHALFLVLCREGAVEQTTFILDTIGQ